MPPTLETVRLRLRPAREDDLDPIYRMGSNPNVMRYITNGRIQNLEEARGDLKRRMDTASQPLGYWIVEVLESGDFVGWMALKPLEGSKEIEIGYRFLEEQWGKGYATEAGRKLLDYAFRTLGLDKVVSVAMEENRASTRVMEKLGMRFVRQGRFYGTRCVYYVIEREQFVL